MTSLTELDRAKMIRFLRQNGAYPPSPRLPISPTPLQRELFPLQKKILDSSSKRKALLCGRRFSKTYLLSVALISSALSNPNSTNLFIAITKAHAKRLIWKQLQDFNEQFGLQGISKSSFVDLSIEFPNGSKIILSGCKYKGDAETFRGDKYSFIAIDEAGSDEFIDHLEYLVEEVLDPSLQDTNGELWLAGTPNSFSEGYFYDITNTGDNKGFEVFRGTVLDNPKFPRWSSRKDWKVEAARWWKEYKKGKGWKDDNPILQREWLALWPASSSRLVLPVSLINISPTTPSNLDYYVGIDTGYVDNFAISVIGTTPDSPICYIVETYQEAKLGYSQVLGKVREIYEKYNPVLMVCDPADAGRHIVEELAIDYQLPIQAAEKHDRVSFIDYFADGFRTGRVQIVEHLTELTEELKAIKWKDKRKGTFVRPKDGHHDLFDATFYAWRHCPSRRWEPEEKEAPRVTDADYYDGGGYERDLVEQIKRERDEDDYDW